MKKMIVVIMGCGVNREIIKQIEVPDGLQCPSIVRVFFYGAFRHHVIYGTTFLTFGSFGCHNKKKEVYVR